MALSFSLRHCIEHRLRAQLPTSLSLRCPPRSPNSHPLLHSGCNHANVVSSCSPDRTPTAIEAAEVSPISGVEEALMGFITGKRKAVEVVHSVWKKIVRKGDVVIDATCGNGHDTLTLVRLVADGSNSESGIVYGLDIQKSALESTSNLLNQFASAKERGSVILFHICHSKMEDVVSKDASVRLVAFNLGYLPGGDKSIITVSQSTLLALQAASRILKSGGIISLVVYVGHHGGREEFETVQSFASSLPADCWASCKFEVLNKPMAPILVLLFKK